MKSKALSRYLYLFLDPFGGAKLRPLGRCVKRRSGSTLSKPQHLCWGAEGLTFCFLLIIIDQSPLFPLYQRGGGRILGGEDDQRRGCYIIEGTFRC